MKLKKPNLTWRTRKRLKTAAIVLGSAAALSLSLWLCWVLWLGRFVVYTGDTVRLDFDWVTPGDYVEAVEPTKPEINIIFDDGSEVVVAGQRLTISRPRHKAFMAALTRYIGGIKA